MCVNTINNVHRILMQWQILGVCTRAPPVAYTSLTYNIVRSPKQNVLDALILYSLPFTNFTGSMNLNELQGKNHAVDKALYNMKRQIIFSKMEYERPNATVIIWSRAGPVNPDFLAIFIKEFDPAVKVRTHWSPRLPWSLNSAAGATAIFCHPSAAELFSKKLQIESR